MADRVVDLGIVTAYAEAVSKGYTGTETEFAQGLKKSAEYADNAQASATAAASSATQASGYATNASTSATEAATSATDASSSASDASNSATAAQGYAEDAQESAEAAEALLENVYTKTEADALLDKKANIDGSYDGMTVGNAEQLVSSIVENDQTPYQFRTAGGNREIGNRENDTIVGGSVAWNQMFNPNKPTFTLSGVTITNNNDGTYTVTGTATADGSVGLNYTIQYLQGHKYLLMVKGASSALRFFDGYGADGYENGNGLVINWNRASSTGYVYIGVKNGETYNTKIVPQFFDLTQMFGITIADYIYSLEQANAGAGVSWFKKLFPKDYYEYNAGEMLHVSGLQSHDMVGFNQWDEEWELGIYNTTTGQPQASAFSIRGKNRFEVVPNTTYYANNNYVRRLYYDADDNFISFKGGIGVDTTPTNCHYMRIYLADAYGTTYKNDICINLHWDGERDGEYEPYIKHSYPLDDSLTLRGIPKLDTDGNLYYDGDTYEHDGTVTRKYGIVDLGTLSWGYTTSYSRGVFYAQLDDRKIYSTAIYPNFICTKYPSSNAVSPSNLANMGDKLIGATYNSTQIIITDDSYTDRATFKSAMSGVYLVYELATPTTESAEPFADPQIVDNWGTEEYVTTSIVPVGHDTDYPVDLKAKVEASPNNPQSDGTYILSYQNGEATYTPLASSATITNIIARLEALENQE